jgi:hypothetical protein
MREQRIVIVFLLAVLLLAGCGETKVIDDVEYDTIGLINQSEKRNPDIQYEPIWGNIVWGGLLVYTVAAPVYFYGFSMWEPICKKEDAGVKGQVIKKGGK